MFQKRFSLILFEKNIYILPLGLYYSLMRSYASPAFLNIFAITLYSTNTIDQMSLQSYFLLWFPSNAMKENCSKQRIHILKLLKTF